MSGNFTDFQANAWLDAIAASSYVALHFDHPEQAGAYMSEYSGGGYGRQEALWTAADNRTMWNTNAIAFSGLVAGTVTYLGGWNTETLGDLIWWVQLSTPRPLSAGQGILIAAEEIVLSVG